MLKKLFFIVLLIVCSFGYAQQIDSTRLRDAIEPTFQFIHFNLDPDSIAYSAETKITLMVHKAVDTFRLHGVGFTIQDIELSQNQEQVQVDYEFAEHDFLYISSRSDLAPGEYHLSININGEISKKGEGITRFSLDSLNYIFTQMEAVYARRHFPCFDEPSFKFPYQLEITAPKHNLFVSNTEIQKEWLSGDLKTVLFKPTRPIPSYLVAFAVGPYDTTPIPNLSIPGRLILPAGNLEKSRYIKQHTASILHALEEYLGTPYPYDKLDLIGVRNYNFGAMENPGLVVLQDAYLIDSDNLSVNDKQLRARIVAHELAHMWFGNLITLHWWDDLWLNEGFATWLEAEIMLQEFPELNSEELLANSIDRPRGIDIRRTAEPVHRQIRGSDNPLLVVDELSYSKSAMLLRCIKHWVGEATFAQALDSYLKTYAWKNVDADDFMRILEDVSGKPVSHVMTDFVYQSGIPLVQVSIDESNNLVLSQQRYKAIENDEIYETLWHIPMTCKIYDGDKIHEKQIYLEQKVQTIPLPDIQRIDWIYMRHNSTGYFIQLLPAEMLQKAIVSEELNVFEKNDVLDGLRYAYLAGDVPPSTILDMAHHFRHSKDMAIIDAMTNRVSAIKYTYEDVCHKAEFNRYCENTLRPMLDVVGYEIQKDELTLQRASRSRIIFALRENPQTRRVIIDLGKAYLNDDTSLNFEYFNYICLLVYYEGNAALYDTILNRIETTQNPDERYFLCNCLGYFRDEALKKRNLDYILEGDLIPLERLFLLRAVQYMHKWDSEESIFPWLAEHYHFFEEHVSLDLFDRFIPNLIFEEDLKIFNQLFPPDKRSGLLQKQIAMREENFKRGQRLRERHADDLREYLIAFKNQ